MPAQASSFAPLSRLDARVLILGSLPGQRSLAAGEYYAQPRNAFWRILATLTGVPADADYGERVAGLIACGFALWDVIATAERPGSLDAAIVPASIHCNDLSGFLAGHPAVRRICFNGRKAGELYTRHWQATLERTGRAMATCQLPSTSPAHAAMPYAEKLRRWRQALAPAAGSADCQRGGR